MGKKGRPDPDDVLDGRVQPDVRDLIALIHDVNPSGRDHLPAAETARRYARKSRLQSLLVRRFGDEIEVEPVPGEPWVCSLRHRGSRVDACHAVVAELDDDARSWVQRALDLGGDGAPDEAMPLHPRRAEETGAPAQPADLLAAGREAIEAYDYDLARRHLERAFDQGSGAAAALLIELLVDVLGADGDALALAARLPPEARSRSDVRSLLALALARSGDRQASLALVQRLPASPRTAAVFAALARRAVEAGDALEAARHLAEARQRSPASPELASVATAIEGLRAPLEEQAQRALAEGRLADAYAGAEALLGRFPESKVAARILRRRDEERRHTLAEKIVRDAEEAMVSGALGQARVLVLKARAEGIRAERTAGIEARIGALEAEARARAAAARVDEVVRLLGDRDPAVGLLAYLGLPASARAAVRARVSGSQLGWLDETGVAEGSGALAKAAVLAVQALSRALADVDRDPRAALDLITPHRKALASVRDAEALVQAGQRALADERRRQAARQLADVERAFADGAEDALRHAERVLAQLRARDLDERMRTRFHDLERRVHGALGQLTRRREIEELRRKGEPLDALRRLDELVDDAEDPGDRHAYLETRAALEGEVLRAYDVRSEAGLPAVPLRLAGPDPVDPPRAILPGGEEVVLARTCGRWVFLWVVDIATGEARRRARLRAVDPVRLQRLVIEGGRLHLVGVTGAELVLDPATWQPLLESGSEISSDLDTDTTIAPGGRYTWVSSGIGSSFDVDVWDGRRDQWIRQNRDSVREAHLRPLFGLEAPGADPPAIAVIRPVFDESISLHAARGTQIASYRKIWLLAKTLVVHPSRETIFAVELLRSDSVHPIRFRIVELDARGAPLAMPDADARCIPFPESRLLLHTVVDAAAGLVFLRLEAEGGGCEILAIRTGARGSRPPAPGQARPVEVLFRAPAPARTLLVEDPGGGPALAIARHERGIEVVRLGAAPPIFRPDPGSPRAVEPTDIRLSHIGECDKPTGARRQAIDTMGAQIWHQPAPMVQARIAKARREGPGAILDLVGAIRYAQRMELMNEAMDAAIEAFPDHPEVLFVRARIRIFEKRWDLMPELLRRVDVAAEPALGRHTHHLLGLALLMSGERAEALDALRRGETFPGDCDLELGLALAFPVGDAEADARPWRPSELAVRALRHAVQVADGCLGAGDPAGAIRVLDTLLVHDAQEVQSLARLAEAYLSVDGDASIDPFVEAQALAAFCGAHGEVEPFTRNELPLSFPRWDTERLDGIAARARAWLDAVPGE